MDAQLDSTPVAEPQPSPVPSAPPQDDTNAKVTPIQKLNQATKAAMKWSSAMVGLKAGKREQLVHSESFVVKQQSKKYGFLHAAVMVLCFGILLATAYTEQQPSRYTKSHVSLKDALKVEDAKQVVTADDIWEWVETIVTGIGGKVVDHIEVNCAYDHPYVQEVTVDGTSYTLLNPEIQTGACFPDNLAFIKGDGQVYLTGNHQLLSFGIFTDRSVPERPIGESNSALYDIEVLDNDISSLNPVRDEKVIEVCNTTVGRRCVLKDAPNGEIGSTLGWDGYEEGGIQYFTDSSSATIYSATDELSTEYEPCYAYVGPPTLNPTLAPSLPPIDGGGPPTASPSPGGTPPAVPGNTSPPTPPPVGGGPPTANPSSAATPPSGSETTPPPSPPPVDSGGPPTEEPSLVPTSVPTAGATHPPSPPPVCGTRQPTEVPTTTPTIFPTFPAKPGPDAKLNRSRSLSTQAEIVDGTCEYMWVTSGYDMRITCTRDRSVQQTARLSYVAAYYEYKDIFGLFDGQFACGQFVELGSSDLDSYFVHGHRNLDAYLDNEDSYGVFFSTSSQLTWTVESTLGLLNLQRNYFIDDNTRIFKVYMIARNLGREQLFYSFVSVSFHIDVDGLIRVEFDVTYVPMIQYYYGIDGYSWRAREVFIFELMLVFLFALFTLRELKQLLVKRIVPLILKWKQNLQSMQVHSEVSQSESSGDVELRSKSKVFDFESGEGENLNQQEAGTVLSSKHMVSFGDVAAAAVSRKGGSAVEPELVSKSGSAVEHEVVSTKNFHEKIDEFGDALEDVLDDYVPDADGLLDILDWMTIIIILIAIIYRFQYVEKARDLHVLIKSLESDGDAFDDYLETLIGDFSELGRIASASNMISIVAVCVGIMQFFRYLSFDRKLGIVTETIFVVSFDLLPVLFIFITIVLAYGVLGTKIYGAQMREWSTLGKSISSLFLMMLGEYGEYFALRDVSAVETGIFFWSFVVIISMILFNMVLAVILTVYEDKYKEVLEADMKAAAALEERNAAALEIAKKKEQ